MTKEEMKEIAIKTIYNQDIDHYRNKNEFGDGPFSCYEEHLGMSRMAMVLGLLDEKEIKELEKEAYQNGQIKRDFSRK